MTAQPYRIAWYNARGRRVRTSPPITNLHTARASRTTEQTKTRARVVVEVLVGGAWEAYE